MIEILLHLFTQHIFYSLSSKRQLRQISGEPFTDRHLAEMTERRIPYVVDQARTLKYMRNIFLHTRDKSGIPAEFQNIFPDILSK